MRLSKAEIERAFRRAWVSDFLADLKGMAPLLAVFFTIVAAVAYIGSSPRVDLGTFDGEITGDIRTDGKYGSHPFFAIVRLDDGSTVTVSLFRPRLHARVRVRASETEWPPRLRRYVFDAYIDDPGVTLSSPESTARPSLSP